jgi:hypothetical protein
LTSKHAACKHTTQQANRPSTQTAPASKLHQQAYCTSKHTAPASILHQQAYCTSKHTAPQANCSSKHTAPASILHQQAYCTASKLHQQAHCTSKHTAPASKSTSNPTPQQAASQANTRSSVEAIGFVSHQAMLFCIADNLLRTGYVFHVQVLVGIVGEEGASEAVLELLLSQLVPPKAQENPLACQ